MSASNMSQSSATTIPTFLIGNDNESFTFSEICQFPVQNLDEINEQICSHDLYPGELKKYYHGTISLIKVRKGEAEVWHLMFHSYMALVSAGLREADRQLTLPPRFQTTGRIIGVKEVYGFANLRSIANTLTSQRMKYISKNLQEKFDLNFMLAYLTYLPGMNNAIVSYLSAPDKQIRRRNLDLNLEVDDEDINSYKARHPGVTATGDFLVRLTRLEKVEKMFLSWYGANDSLHKIETPYQDFELEFIAFMIIVCTIKTFVTEQHFSVYAASRCTAFASHMNYEDLSWDILQRKFDPPSMTALHGKISFYPKLKRVIFSTILDSNETWAQYCQTIISDSQLTSFNFIYIFLTKYRPTKAHFYPAVQNEIKKFKIAFDKASDVYGTYLRYAKLLNPQDQTMASTNWATLASLALYTLYAASGQESLVRFKLKIRPTVRLLEALTCEVKEIYLADGMSGTSTFTESELRFMNIKPENFDITRTDLFTEINETLVNKLKDFVNLRHP